MKWWQAMAWLHAASLVAGCGIPLTDEAVAIGNACGADSDCGPGGVCREARCISTQADLAGLAIQIDVPSGAPFAEGTSHLLFPADDGIALEGQRASGFLADYDLTTSDVASVTVSLAVDPLPEPCSLWLADQRTTATFPILVQLQPVGFPPGIALTSYTAPSSSIKDAQTEVADHQAVLVVPAGSYDVHIIPVAPDPNDPLYPDPDTEEAKYSAYEACRVHVEAEMPPVVLHDHDIQQASFDVAVSVTQPSTLSGTARNFDLEGWLLDMVENRQGRVISTRFELATVSAEQPAPFTLKFWPELIDAEGIEAVVRLTPPEHLHTQGMPTMMWKLDGLDIFGTGVVDIDLAEIAKAEPIEVHGGVAAESDSAPVPATVVIRSKELLEGSFGGNIAFRTTVDTDGNGNFNQWLLPGVYTVQAKPVNAPGLAFTKSTLEVASGDFGGKTITVRGKRALVGSALTPTEEAAHGVPVLLTPTPPASTSYIRSELSSADLLPSGASAFTNGSGEFALDVDAGEYTLWLQPEPASDLPWALLARLTIPDVAEQPTPRLSVAISNPVVLRGRVLSPEGDVIANARIRAWVAPAPLAGEEQAESVIQVAETTSDARGDYELLLPASIAASISQ